VPEVVVRLRRHFFEIDLEMKNLLICFAAGCLGGLANSLALWGFGVFGITGALGVSISPPLTPVWLYPRIVWGGIWGIVFVLPFMRSKVWSRGIVLSILPTIVQLFFVFPYQAGKGVMGLKLGMLTPLLVVLLNAVWGMVTSLTIKISK